MSTGSVSASQSRNSVPVSASGSQVASVQPSQVDLQKKPKKEKLIKNQFNFSDRGSQSGLEQFQPL